MTDTIYFAGGEDIDFLPISGSLSTNTTTSNFDSTVSRASVAFSVSHVTTSTPANGFKTPLWSTAVSVFWAKVASSVGSDNTTSNVLAFWFYDPSGTMRLCLRWSATNRVLKLSTVNAAGAFTDIATATAALSASTFYVLDMQVNYTSSGSFNLYANGTLILTASAVNLLTDSATTLQQFGGCPTGNGFTPWSISQVLVSSGDTRTKKLVTLTNSTAGTNQQFTGTASNLAATSYNDANFVYSVTNGQYEEFTPRALPSGVWSVDGVVMNARALVGASGPQHLAFVSRIGTTEYPTSNVSPLTSFASTGPMVIQTNPATASPWTTSDIGSFQYGVEAVT